MAFQNVHDYVLFAISSGELYQRQCEMARVTLKNFKPGSAQLVHRPWNEHVRGAVMTLYRRQVNKYARITYDDMNEVAAQLRTYYENHVKETDACSTHEA